MGNKRTWDESQSPQWRYLLSKDSKERREAEKREERADQAEGEPKASANNKEGERNPLLGFTRRREEQIRE